MSYRRSTVLVLAAAMVMLAMLVAPPVLAQTNPNGPTIPGAAGLGPPAWVKPGTRITFHNAAATVGGSPSVFVEDPNGPWQDPSTGKHYSMQESASSDTQGSGGDGVSQVDVVAIEGTDVVLSESGYAIDRLNGVHFIPGGAPSGGRLPGGQPGDTWVSPELLAGVVPSNLGGMLLLRGDFVLDGTTYQAVSLVRPDPTNYASYTYDTESGVLLAEDTQTQGTVPGTDPQVPSGDTFMTVTHLAGIRQRDVPGLAGTNPEWVASTAGLTYSGTEVVTNPLLPSAGGLTFPMHERVTFGPGGANWATYTADIEVDMQGVPPQQSETKGVTSTAGLFWYDTTTLAGLQPGQVLDQDPLTGGSTTVSAVGPGPNGQAVTIVDQVPGITTTSVYDATTGVLLAAQVKVDVSGTTYTLELDSLP